jgi:hypothetical protein
MGGIGTGGRHHGRRPVAEVQRRPYALSPRQPCGFSSGGERAANRRTSDRIEMVPDPPALRATVARAQHEPGAGSLKNELRFRRDSDPGEGRRPAGGLWRTGRTGSHPAMARPARRDLRWAVYGTAAAVFAMMPRMLPAPSWIESTSAYRFALRRRRRMNSPCPKPSSK